MFNKFFILLFLLVFLSLHSCFAGENITLHDDYHNVTPYTGENVTALEDGHFNINFSDGSNGYCLEYGEKEATLGDEFIVKDTSYARNTYSDEDVSNYLKTYFVDYYDYAMKDKIVTQHTIWHFTDNFNGWRVNQSLVQSIKDNPSFYPDSGVKRINDTTEMVYSFSVFMSHWEHHQNFWSYFIYFRNITLDNNTNSTGNISDDVNGSVLGNESDDIINNSLLSNLSVFDVYDIGFYDDSSKNSSLNESIVSLNQHLTGNSIKLLIVILIFGILCILGLYCIQEIIWRKIK